jgi:PAS domain S-box-containing protein
MSYPFAVAAVLAAIIIRLLFFQSLANEYPFLVFYPAVAAVAIVAGFWPGVLATVLSAVAAHYLWLDHTLQHWFTRGEMLAIGIFCSGGLLVSYMALVASKARRKLIAAESAAAVAQADLQRRELEERFKVLTEVTLEGIVLSEEGEILDVNEQFCTMLGYERGEILGKRLSDLVLDPQDKEEVQKRMQEGVENLAEYAMVRKDGSIVRAEIHGRNATYRNGAVRITSIRDITKRIEQEQELRKEREILGIFVEHAPVPLAMFDRDMRYICASRRWIDLNALGKVDIKGISHYETSSNIKEEWKEAHRRGLAGETVAAEGDRYLTAEGSEVWVDWEVHPWYQSDGNVGGIIIFSEDVTRQKQYEEQLKELNQRLTYHMENSPLAVIEWGADMRLIRWAGAAERVFGWKAEEVLGKRIEDMQWVYEDDQPQVEEVSSDLSTGHNRTRFSANRNYRKDGTVVFCEWYNSSLVDDCGHLRSILAFALDITERKKLEESLKLYSENLEGLVKERTDELLQKDRLLMHQSRLAAMGEMINAIAHQWRQPLNVLGLHIQSLPKTCAMQPEANLETLATECMKLIRHMSATVDEFRDFFRPDSAKSAFDVSASVRKAVELVASGFLRSNIVIETDLRSDATVYGYPNQFAQAVLCILQNARDALLQHEVHEGHIVITSEAAGDRVMVTIEDNAGGVPEEIKDKIFDSYFTTKGEAGTGIGLYITKMIVESMGGTIFVENGESGARFIIEIPATASLD